MILPNHDRYREYTDEELEAFFESFPQHIDRPLVFREQELRQRRKREAGVNDRAKDQHPADVERHGASQTQGESRWFWAKVAGIAAIIGIIAVVLQGTRLSSFRRASTTTSSASATSSPRTVPDDVLSMPSPTEEPPLAELLASPTPSPTVVPE